MKVIGLAGWSGAGKTTLLTRVIPHLLKDGLRVSVIKHAHHAFDVDVPGKDSWVHREAGATEVLVSSSQRWALMHELRGADEPRLPELLAKMSRVDLVVVEGFKREPHRKIEVHRAANAKPLLFPDDPGIVGIATDTAIETTLPTAHLDDIDGRRRHDAARGDPGRRRAGEERERGLRAQMAQLSDDCFAFGGPMMSVDEAVGLIAARVDAGAGCRDRRARRRRWPHSRARYCGAAAAAAFHQFRRRWLCGARAAICRKARSRHFPSTGRVQAGASAHSADQARRRRCASSRARRCLTAPTPCSCRKTSASKAARSFCRRA